VNLLAKKDDGDVRMPLRTWARVAGRSLIGELGGKLVKDIEIAHRRRWPERPMSLISCSWLLAISPCLRLMLTHRIAHWLHLKHEERGWRAWQWYLMVIPLKLLRLAVEINTKSDIASGCEIEGGVCFSDQGHIIFGAGKTGAGTVIGARVTVGMSYANSERPEIGRNVWIGSDCVIHGAIKIGDGATLLPGTVLTKSIPAGVVMQGNLARLVLRNFDNSELRKRSDPEAIAYAKTKWGD